MGDINDTKSREGKISVGVTGKMGAGKSTVAHIIADTLDGQVLSIAGKFKALIKELELPYHREILQETGDFFRRWDELVWIRSVLKTAQSVESPVVIDDIRYHNERDELKKHAFWIIRVVATEETRRTRIARRDLLTITDEEWESWKDHATEREISEIEVDFEVENNGSLDNLRTQLLAIIAQITKNT